MKKNLIVVGALWGDEGKGKIIDVFAPKFCNIVRSQGGDNAGHSLEVKGNKYKLRLLPSGVLHNNKTIVIGQGVALNIETLLKEMNEINSKGFKFNLKISDRAHIVMPYHIQMDILDEEIKGVYKVGTTKRGIGPCYSDKINRLGIRVCDLFEKDILLRKISLSLKFKNIFFKHFNKPLVDAQKITDMFFEYGKKISNYIDNTGKFLDSEMKKGRYSLFEGAQGVMLCVENGTYPYVTSSSPSAASVCLSNGIRQDSPMKVLGITKAYISRVGEGPFPTELSGKLADHIREVGREYGTVTKRPRRVGWMDLILMKHSIRVSGINGLAITLIDVLSGIDIIKVCVGYEIRGKVITDFPCINNDFDNLKPVYKELKGWKEDISKIHDFEQFPENCKKYIKFIENELNIKVDVISNGPSRKNTIILNKEMM